MSLDPEDDTSDGNSTNMSKSNLQQAWEAWTSNPANNAALLQTGIALMQPRGPGQSGLGAFANAIGEGGQAAARVNEQQQAEDAADLKESQVNSENAYRGQEGQAAITNANAYSQAVKQNSAGGKGISGQIATQRQFNAWLSKAEDPLALQMTNGVSNDPIVQALQKQFPDIKTKGDILANPAALLAAKKLFAASIPDPGDAGTTSTAPVETPAPAAVPKPMMYKGRMIHVDPLKKQWVFEDGTPAQ